MDLISFLRVLYQRKYLIALVVGISVVTTFLLTTFLPDQYRAEAELSVGVADALRVGSSENSELRSVYELGPRFSAMIDMITSDKVMTLLSYELALHDLQKPEPFREITGIRKEYGEAGLRAARKLFRRKLDNMEALNPGEQGLYGKLFKDMDYQPSRLKGSIEVEQDPGTDHLKISFTTEDKELSAFAVNALCRVFSKYYKAVNIEQTDDAIEFLSRLAAQKKQLLDMQTDKSLSVRVADIGQAQKQQAKAVFIRQVELVLNQEVEKRKVRMLKGILKNLDTRMSEAEKEYMQKQALRHKDEIIDLREEFERLNRRRIYVSTSRQYTGGVADSLEILRKRIGSALRGADDPALESFSIPAQERIRHRVDVQIKWEEAQMAQVEIAEALEALKTRTFWVKEEEWLAREVFQMREDYISVLHKLNQARIASLNPSSPLRQVVFAAVPANPVPTQHGVLVGVAGAASFLLCVVVLFLLEYIDITLRNKILFERLSGLSALGALNSLPSTGIDLIKLFSTTQADSTLELYKQNLRKIRFEVLSTDAKSILVTSTQDRVGKSSFVLALAYALSLNNKKVLILDTNLKNHDLTSVLYASTNLEAYLAGDVISEKQLIVHSGLPGVDMVGCEGSDLSPAELFDNKRFREFLDRMKERYHFILMEGPALNLYADSKELASYADKILPVFSARTALKTPDQHSIDFLKRLEQKLMPAVLNFVSVKEMS